MADSKNIEDIHKNNFEVIDKYNLRVNQLLKNKKTNRFYYIFSIHSLYGWVTVKNFDESKNGYGYSMINLLNIDEYELYDSFKGIYNYWYYNLYVTEHICLYSSSAY